jgi:pyruvate dehydrogenase E2 component (dihydrolipoamide acetyltransferase)
MVEFKLPDVGEGIHEAEIVRWLVAEGDTVSLDQPLVEIQTDKALVEIPSPVAGLIADIRVQPGQMAYLGDVLVTIQPETPAKALVLDSPSAAPAQISEPVATPAAAVIQPGLGGPGQRVLAAPAVRRLARELGVDLAQVPGSGPAGRILPGDVRQFVRQPPAGPAPEAARPAAKAPPATPAPPPAAQADREIIEREALHGLRRRIAERMQETLRVPQVTSLDEIDAGQLVALRQSLRAEVESRGARLTFTAILVKMITQVLKAMPYFNASLDLERQEILVRRYYHIGIATAIPDGLVVPVLRHADQLSLFEIAVELERLADLARQRRLSPAELAGSTFTLTNFGSFGGYLGTPLINPPEVAILGMGRISDKPVAVAGEVAIRPLLPLALSYDHRLLDGAAAGEFLGRLGALVENPQNLLLELR